MITSTTDNTRWREAAIRIRKREELQTRLFPVRRDSGLPIAVPVDSYFLPTRTHLDILADEA